MQYANLGSLRRALRANENSLAYKKSHYAIRDYQQYQRWKSVIGEKNMPSSLAEFQELKYNKDGQFNELKAYKEYVTVNPKATKADYKKVIVLKEKGIKGDIHIPPQEIDIVKLDFDNEHINIERKHGVTESEAKQFIKEAKVSISKWNGKYENYFSKNGAVYVDIENRIIRTTFMPKQFDDQTKNIVEVVDE